MPKEHEIPVSDSPRENIVMTIPCSICKADSHVSTAEIDVPHFGPVLILKTQCSSCGFKHSDIYVLKNNVPSVYTMRVEGVEDLKARVVRSNTALIRIPQLGIQITPGPYAESYISNIEGILERLENAARSIMTLNSKDSHRTQQEAFLARISAARNGEMKFTVIIKDPAGNSVIISQKSGKVRKRKLSPREIEAFSR